MNRSDVFWSPDGPEYEPEETDAERAKRIEEKTALTNNQLELLAMILKGMRQ